MKKLLIVKRILLVNTLGIVWNIAWRICILMLRRKGLKELLKTSCITQTSAKIVKVEYTKTTS